MLVVLAAASDWTWGRGGDTDGLLVVMCHACFARVYAFDGSVCARLTGLGYICSHIVFYSYVAIALSPALPPPIFDCSDVLLMTAALDPSSDDSSRSTSHSQRCWATCQSRKNSVMCWLGAELNY